MVYLRYANGGGILWLWCNHAFNSSGIETIKEEGLSEDVAIAKLIERETARQRDGLEMIPSENHTSLDVLAALGCA